LLTKEENERFCRIGPGTDMGTLFRRYWYPIASASEMEEEPVKAVRILGEDLVLFRDREGRYGLVEPQCPHRKAGLVFGIPENEGLRCAYHGWMFDTTGRCVEQPAEDMDAPDSTFAQRTSVKAYKAQELGGLVFAYLGPEPAPLLPDWELLVKPGLQRSIGWAVIPCNWMQIMDNSLDPTHVEWLHRRFDNYVLERLGKRELSHDVRHHKKIGFDVFEFGIVKRRMWDNSTEESPEWALGHPIVFPNILVNVNSFQYRVPIDDEHTLHVWYNARPAKPGQPVQQDVIPNYEVPIPGVDARGHPTWSTLDNNSGQDSAMWYTQGPITDRTNEKLGTSDKGIILFRKLLTENMETAIRGDDPMGVIRDASRNVCIHIATEEDAGGIAERKIRNVGDRAPTGSSGKYDPLLVGKSALELEKEGIAVT
jgi:5,5'-dehydrodivanillate O-demethylase oxygenase subunit